MELASHRPGARRTATLIGRRRRATQDPTAMPMRPSGSGGVGRLWSLPLLDDALCCGLRRGRLASGPTALGTRPSPIPGQAPSGGAGLRTGSGPGACPGFRRILELELEADFEATPEPALRVDLQVAAAIRVRGEVLADRDVVGVEQVLHGDEQLGVQLAQDEGLLGRDVDVV